MASQNKTFIVPLEIMTGNYDALIAHKSNKAAIKNVRPSVIQVDLFLFMPPSIGPLRISKRVSFSIFDLSYKISC
jgi:hypothetical protein